MAGGASAGDALAALTARTADMTYRQLSAVDAAGGSAAYSGELALGEAADVLRPGTPPPRATCWPTIGVPAAMLAAFADRAGDAAR